VRKKRVQEALQALREGFQEAGTPIAEATIDFVTNALKSPRFLQLLVEQPEQLALASVVAGVLSTAEKNRQPEERWKRDLEKLKKEMPYMMRSVWQAEVRDHFKGLPKKPGTGRHRLLKTARERKKACDLVSKYNREGDSFRTAYARVAAEMNCSARTVQRAWIQRPRKRNPNQRQTASPNL
jgi:hypothetical protein